MKVCIVGLGAIGGTFAAWLGSRLPADEVSLSALARGATLAAVQAQGLRVEAAPGMAPLLAVPLRVASDARELGVQDLVILAVKGPALQAVAPAVQALCGPHTQVLCAMNGVPWWFFEGLPGSLAGLSLHSVDPDARVRGLIPAIQVVGCVVHLSSSAPAPGAVRHVNGNGLIIGRPAGSGGEDPSLQALAALLQRAGFGVTVSDRIQRDIWFKLWGNMTMNPVSALTGAPCDRILDDPLVRGFISAVMREAAADRRGHRHPDRPGARRAPRRDAQARQLQDQHAGQDLLAGRPLELDALVGAVREIGQHLGLATPNIDALLGLVRLMASERGLYTPPMAA
jgi:2-dehydropantoate 2-reductase